MALETDPIARTAMLIRRPVAEVFDAFVNPSVTRHFWFSRGTERLAPGARVTWDWEVYGVSADVLVTAFEPLQHLRIEWPTPVDFHFEARGAGATLVTIVAAGFVGSDEARLAQALDAVGGFSLTLAGAKAWLEHGIELRLVEDQNPDAHVPSDG